MTIARHISALVLAFCWVVWITRTGHLGPVSTVVVGLGVSRGARWFTDWSLEK